jgi:dynein heavy chain, axonemal
VNIISCFYNPDMQDDSYKFSTSGIYFAPPEGSLQSYREYISTLPFSEGPEVFGLHENGKYAPSST